jgi:hypothetical protein
MRSVPDVKHVPGTDPLSPTITAAELLGVLNSHTLPVISKVPHGLVTLVKAPTGEPLKST